MLEMLTDAGRLQTDTNQACEDTWQLVTGNLAKVLQRTSVWGEAGDPNWRMAWDRRLRCQERPALNSEVCSVGKLPSRKCDLSPSTGQNIFWQGKVKRITAFLTPSLPRKAVRKPSSFFMRNYEMMLQKQFKERSSWAVASGKKPPLPCRLQRNCVYRLCAELPSGLAVWKKMTSLNTQ